MRWEAYFSKDTNRKIGFAFQTLIAYALSNKNRQESCYFTIVCVCELVASGKLQFVVHKKCFQFKYN